MGLLPEIDFRNGIWSRDLIIFFKYSIKRYLPPPSFVGIHTRSSLNCSPKGYFKLYVENMYTDRVIIKS